MAASCAGPAPLQQSTSETMQANNPAVTAASMTLVTARGRGTVHCLPPGLLPAGFLGRGPFCPLRQVRRLCSEIREEDEDKGIQGAQGGGFSRTRRINNFYLPSEIAPFKLPQNCTLCPHLFNLCPDPPILCPDPPNLWKEIDVSFTIAVTLLPRRTQLMADNYQGESRTGGCSIFFTRPFQVPDTRTALGQHGPAARQSRVGIPATD